MRTPVTDIIRSEKTRVVRRLDGYVAVLSR